MISTSTGLLISRPTTDMVPPTMTAPIKAVAVALLRSSNLFAPNNCPIKTADPIPNPAYTAVQIIDMAKLVLTAANADDPTNLPTTMESTTLYRAENTFPNKTGSENSSMGFNMGPTVKSTCFGFLTLSIVSPLLFKQNNQ